MFCSNCGNQLLEGALFCQKCGVKVDIEEDTTYQTRSSVSNDTANHRDDMEDVHMNDKDALRAVSSDKAESKNPYADGRGKLNREKQFERYKKIPNKILGNLKDIPYQRGLNRLKKVPLICKVGIGIIVLLVIIILSSTFRKPGRDVRESYLDYYSNSVTVEEAFDSFFENGKWSEHKENGDTYVVFSGVCWYLDEKVNVKIRFKIQDDYFYFANMEMNGEPQSDIISEGLFDKVYESFY